MDRSIQTDEYNKNYPEQTEDFSKQIDAKKIAEMLGSMNRKQKRNYCKVNKLDFNKIFTKKSKEENEKTTWQKGWRS